MTVYNSSFPGLQMDKADKNTPTDTTVIIRAESDFPTSAIHPFSDGELRHKLPLKIANIFDVDQITIEEPFLLEPSFVTISTTEFSSLTNTIVTYNGTSPLFYGRDSNDLTIRDIRFVATVPGTKFIDVVGTLFSLLKFRNVSVEGFDLGNITNYFIDWNFSQGVKYTDSYKIHNSLNLFIDVAAQINVPVPSSNNPFLVITNNSFGVGVSTINEVTSVLDLNSGQSLLAIDSNINIPALRITNSSFLGTAGTSFFQLDLTGSISAFADLSVLITGTATSYVNDGFGNVLVTDADHDVYVGLTVDNTGSTTYSGQHLVIKELGKDNYVIDATYTSDEIGSFAYTGIGTRVTTTIAHKLTEHRTTDISATTNYNATGLEVLNAATPDFDIVTAFVADDATGTYLTSSLDQTDVKVNAENNGALPDSMKIADISLLPVSPPFSVGPSATLGDLVPIAGTEWNNISEEFTVDSAGLATYNGINPTQVNFSFSTTIESSTGGAEEVRAAMFVDGVEDPTTNSITNNNNPTHVGNFGTFLAVTGTTFQLGVGNNGSTSNTIEVSLAKLIVRS